MAQNTLNRTLTEEDLVNINYQEVVKLYRNWKNAENAIHSKNKEIKQLTTKCNSLHESNLQLQGRMKALESVKDLTVTFQSQLMSIKNENHELKIKNEELMTMNVDLENILNDKMLDENHQLTQLSTLHEQFTTLTDKYNTLMTSNQHIDITVAKEKALIRSYETQIQVLENKIASYTDETYKLKGQNEIAQNRLRQCDEELAHASNQLYQLSIEFSKLQHVKQEVIDNTWEINLLKTDITRLLVLLEHIPSSSEFLLKWQDAQTLSYMPINENDNITTILSRTGPGRSVQDYDRPPGSTQTINYPYSGTYDEAYYEQAWKDVGFTSSAELSHLKRIYNPSSSHSGGGQGTIENIDFEHEIEQWTPQEALYEGLHFMENYFPHVSKQILYHFLKKVNKIWKAITRRKLKRIQTDYEATIHDLKRQLANVRPYRNVMAEREIKILKTQIKKERQKTYQGRPKRLHESNEEDYLLYDSEDEEDRKRSLPTHHRRLCQEVRHLQQLIDTQTQLLGPNTTTTTTTTNTNKSISMPQGGYNKTTIERTGHIIIDHLTAKNLLEVSLESLQIMNEQNKQLQQSSYQQTSHYQSHSYPIPMNPINPINHTMMNSTSASGVYKQKQPYIDSFLSSSSTAMYNDHNNENNSYLANMPSYAMNNSIYTQNNIDTNNNNNNNSYMSAGRKLFSNEADDSRMNNVIPLSRTTAYSSQIEDKNNYGNTAKIPNFYHRDPFLQGAIWLSRNINVLVDKLYELYEVNAREYRIIVGAGPSGLFAAVTLVHAGYTPIILERGYPVEQRGKDIGALFNRKILNSESNLCYGEGGAGTWSDGKLTTRIGKNSDDVRNVLKTLVHHGAPERILIDNKPHLGTDRLVRILKDLRQWLIENGSEFRFGCKVNDIIMNNGASNVQGIQQIKGVKLESGEILDADFVVLAVGHSARGLYQTLNHHNILLLPKPIAVGFRIEHPQELINKIQYGDIFSQQTLRGKGSIPVADYRLATQIPSTTSTTTSTATAANTNDSSNSKEESNIKKLTDSADTSSNNIKNSKFNKLRDMKKKKDDSSSSKTSNEHTSSNSNSSSNNDQDKNKQEKVEGGGGDRGCYSFCMCPGGQIVPTSVDPHELCVNGMSFSQRQSPYANAALVVTVNPSDLGYKESSDTSSLSEKVDPLIGVYWQQEIERKAAIMGGGNLVSPVQRVTDFLSEVPTPANGGLNYHSEYYGDTNLRIPSSYRMGVVGAACHEIYPDYVTKSLQQALLNFDRELRGFITPDAILHGVETRTSSPIQIVRDSETYECLSVNGLYPTGEGAGYAGGIVSAAVDGVKVGNAIIDTILGRRVSSNHNNNNIEENPIKKSSSTKKLYIPTSY